MQSFKTFFLENVSVNDKDYLFAVKANDTSTLNQMVEQAAKQNGYTIKAYHGTSRADRVGTRFLKKRATSGPMAFFTDNPEIATNYSKGKQDTSYEMPDDYRDWFKYKLNKTHVVNIRDLWNYLPFSKKTELTKNLYTVGYSDPDSGEGEIVRDSSSIMPKDSIDYELRQAKNNALEAAKEIWLSSGSLFNQEKDFLDVLKAMGLPNVIYADPHQKQSKVYDVYLKISNPLVTSEISEEHLNNIQRAASQSRKVKDTYNITDPWGKNYRYTPMEWIKQLKEDIKKDVNSYVWTSIPDLITNVLKRMGHDGIIDTGGKGGGTGHNVFIPFNPNQIKSADPVTRDHRGYIIKISHRFNPASPDIRY